MVKDYSELFCIFAFDLLGSDKMPNRNKITFTLKRYNYENQ
jgi:hypothetical protein